jgi:hypothetical protein
MWFKIKHGGTRYVASLEPAKGAFSFQKDGTEIHYSKSRSSSDILESRLCGKEGSLFAYHYPLGIEITEFARLIFQKQPMETLMDIQVYLYEVLPFMFYAISLQMETSLTYYEQESVFVTLLMDDTFDLYEIGHDDGIYPPSF